MVIETGTIWKLWVQFPICLL